MLRLSVASGLQKQQEYYTFAYVSTSTLIVCTLRTHEEGCKITIQCENKPPADGPAKPVKSISLMLDFEALQVMNTLLKLNT